MDILQKDLSINNTVKVAIGTDTPTAINKSAGISAYSIEEITVGEDKVYRFAATIASLAPGETMTITVPATVNADNNTVIENTAYVTGYNGMTFAAEDYITSQTTYHVVADIKAKIKKVNSKGEGLRFVTSLSESLISSINGIGKISTASSEAMSFGVEYGYIVGTEANINTFTDHYQVKDPADYQLRYNGENVNGKDTTGKVREVDQDFRFITNVNCTSKRGQGTTNNNSGIVMDDHRYRCDDHKGVFYLADRRYGTADRRYDGLGERRRRRVEGSGSDPYLFRRGLVMGISLLCQGAPDPVGLPDRDPVRVP